MEKLHRSNCPRLPIVRKCCFCVPILKGVTIFGYVNLALNIISLPLMVYLFLDYITSGKIAGPTHANLDPLFHLPITIVFCIIDAVLTLVLLIGTHRKKKLLLKIYLYLGVLFQLVTLILDVMYLDYREYIQSFVYIIFLSFNMLLLYLVYSSIYILKSSSEVQYTAYQEPLFLSA